MAILRAGPWGNLTDSFQNVPAATDVELTYYPVNIAKGNWPNQNWTAWYEVEAASGCNGPATITATSLFFGNIQLTKQAGDGCTYYWVSPYGPFSGGEAYVIYQGGTWGYEQWISYAPFDITAGGSDPDDPTGTYSGTFNTYTITTP
ncbi:MAG: hypothetical protein ACPG4J_08860 [Lentibacter algarum]